jgi:hypothetical protein
VSWRKNHGVVVDVKMQKQHQDADDRYDNSHDNMCFTAAAGASVWPCTVWGLQHNADVPARRAVGQVLRVPLCHKRQPASKLGSQRGRRGAAAAAAGPDPLPNHPVSLQCMESIHTGDALGCCAARQHMHRMPGVLRSQQVAPRGVLMPGHTHGRTGWSNTSHFAAGEASTVRLCTSVLWW